MLYDISSDMQEFYLNKRLKNQKEYDRRLREVRMTIKEWDAINNEFKELEKEELDKMMSAQSVSEIEKFAKRGKQLTKVKNTQLTNILIKYGYPEDYLEPIYDCKKCKDNGKIEVINNSGPLVEAKVIECDCYKANRLAMVNNRGGIYQRMQTDNLDNFDIELFSTLPYEDEEKSPRDNVIEIIEIITGIASSDKNPATTLFLYGGIGRGKTFLMSCAFKLLFDAKKDIEYIRAYELLDVIKNKDSFDRTTKNNAVKIMERIYDVDYLIIDDLGAEDAKQYDKDSFAKALTGIFDARMISKTTLISSNVIFGDVEEYYGKRAFGRLIESNSRVYRMYGDDLRLKKRMRK